MYVIDGMIEAARSEGEMAGLMATNSARRTPSRNSQATKDAEVSSRRNRRTILGSVFGGGLGQVIGQAAR